jgi:hypothetical protein
VVGGALGSFVAPGVGTALGGKLGAMAGGLFEMELESMGPEEAEFEVARRVVRLAASSARNAALAPPNAPPAAVATKAVAAAARVHAPGLARRMPGAKPHVRGRGPASGRWVRRGRVIVILGA